MDKGIAFFALLGVGLVCLMIWAGVQERREWETFKTQHNCVEIGEMKGDVVTGVGPTLGGNGGVAVTISRTPDKTGWACDDGKQYWR